MNRKTSGTATSHRGSDKLLLGIVLAVVTFWLFAQTTLNIASTMRADLRISESLNNISVSITALFSGIFIVVAGGLADRIGRVKVTYAGLAFSILGSLLIAISPSGTAVFLMAGRVIQGLSAACIMPATLALLKAYFDGAGRQRAVSFWSIGSWGGSGLCSLFGGLIASSLGWRWIFWMSIVVALASFLLIRGTPESKETGRTNAPFDWLGLIAFIIAMVALNVVIGQGTSLGWTSLTVLVLIAVFSVAAIIFFRVELSRANSFVDLTLFKNKTFAGATLSNFLLNGAAGTLIVALALVQQAAGLSSLQSGLLTVGYLVAILSTIRVGEKLFQKMGARKPMLYGCLITAAGILLTCCTFLLARQYLVAAFVGFTLFGIGLGFYATPSTDAALSNVPQDKGGSASGLYKMASSLGAAFGVAISAAIFSALGNLGSQSPPLSELFLGRTDNTTIRFAAAMGLLFNFALAVIAAVAIIVTVPKDDPDKARALRNQSPSRNRSPTLMPRKRSPSIQVYGCNHVAIEVGDIKKAVAFYADVFGLEKLDQGEGDAFFKLGEHQFLAMFERKGMRRDEGDHHFGIMVRDDAQIARVRAKLTRKYKLKLLKGFRCDFRDPWGNRIQVVDLHDESLIWLLPYREVQRAGVKFGG